MASGLGDSVSGGASTDWDAASISADYAAAVALLVACNQGRLGVT